MTGQSTSNRTVSSLTAFTESSERTKQCGTMGLYTLINYLKRKLRQAKHPNETKSIKDTNEQAKVTTNTLPKEQRR